MMLLGSLFGGAATASVPGIAGAATLVPAAATGASISGILSGAASVLGIVSSIAGGAAEADAAAAQEIDMKREQALENLQGIDRRRSLKAAAAEAIGEQDVAYAASGVDLSFGSANVARRSAYRELDLATTSDAGTQETRLIRLNERAAGYRSMRKRALLGGFVDGLSGGLAALT